MKSVSMFSIVVVTFVGIFTPNPQASETITVSFFVLPEGAKPLEMVLIPGGTFTMGCPRSERGNYAFEWPPHQVTISKPFYFGKYEVTQAQWVAAMNGNPSKFRERPNHPVESFTWDECQTFIAKLNAMGQGTFRLPTEAEWEYACRAGTTTRYSFGDALECKDLGEQYCPLMDRYMWWWGNNEWNGNTLGTKEVGLKLPNPWGLYDLHGNVAELCSDWFEYPYQKVPQLDPPGPTPDIFRVIRGGDWHSNARYCRSAGRSACDLTSASPRTSGIGLRLVREYP